MGILPTMVDYRLNEHNLAIEEMQYVYGKQVQIFTPIPRSIRASEASRENKSVLYQKIVVIGNQV